MAAHTNPNLTKQPNKHQTRKDKELQKEKRKKDCPNKTKPKHPPQFFKKPTRKKTKTNHKNYLPKQKDTPQKTPKPTIQNNLPEQNGAQKNKICPRKMEPKPKPKLLF